MTRPLLNLPGSLAQLTAVPVDEGVCDDEGHGPSTRQNPLETNRRRVEFLGQYLKLDLSQRGRP